MPDLNRWARRTFDWIVNAVADMAIERALHRRRATRTSLGAISGSDRSEAFDERSV